MAGTRLPGEGADPLGCLERELEADAIRIREVERLRDRMVGCGERLAPRDEPLECSTERRLTREVQRQMEEPGEAAAHRSGGSGMQHDVGVPSLVPSGTASSPSPNTSSPMAPCQNAIAGARRRTSR